MTVSVSVSRLSHRLWLHARSECEGNHREGTVFQEYGIEITVVMLRVKLLVNTTIVSLPSSRLLSRLRKRGLILRLANNEFRK